MDALKLSLESKDAEKKVYIGKYVHSFAYVYLFYLSNSGFQGRLLLATE